MKRALLFFLGLVLALSGCAQGSARSGESRRIKIAVMDTQDVFGADDSYFNGITMAIEDLNALYSGQGYQIEYEFFDDGSVFQQGISVVNQIISDPEIVAVIGTSSLNILDVSADMLESAGKIFITYYGAPDSLLENGYQYVFRNCYGENDLGTAVAVYAGSRPDMKRIAVYHSDTGYERGMVRAFLRTAAQRGLTVVDVANTTQIGSELDTLLERWRQLDADTVFVSQYLDGPAFDILQRVRTMDPDMNILGDFSFDYTDRLIEYSAVSDDIYIAAPTPLDPGAALKDFEKRYQEKYHSEPTQWTVQLYDSVRMVADTAVRIGSTDPAEIARALHQESGYEGVGGTIAFDARGCMLGRYPRIMVSDNGRFGYVEERRS